MSRLKEQILAALELAKTIDIENRRAVTFDDVESQIKSYLPFVHEYINLASQAGAYFEEDCFTLSENMRLLEKITNANSCIKELLDLKIPNSSNNLAEDLRKQVTKLVARPSQKPSKSHDEHKIAAGSIDDLNPIEHGSIVIREIIERSSKRTEEFSDEMFARFATHDAHISNLEKRCKEADAIVAA